MSDDRKELLLKMYDQMFNDISRHILVVWQSVGVIVGSFAIFALVEKNIIPMDVASAIILLLCFWLLAHLHDASYWYNRNLIIIANIEKQFLVEDDLKNIHYYFGKHRSNNNMITHLKIQYCLGLGIACIIILFHMSERVLPGIHLSIEHFQPSRAIPYIILTTGALYVIHLKNECKKKYNLFLLNCPGAPLNTAGYDYSSGHGQE